MEIFLCILCCLYILLLPTYLCYYFLLPSTKRGETNMIMQDMMERLRPLVGSKGWDFCVLWKLSEDHRFVEWMSCCCGGSENSQNNNVNNGGDEELLFPVSPLIPCRDNMFQHPRTNSCDLLSQLPTSMPLDSGIYAQTLISNQPSWLNSSSVTCSHFLEEPIGTRVLIPLPGGLVELFVNKQIQEDQNVIDYITSQCNISLDHHHHDSMISNNNTSFIMNINNHESQSRPFLGNEIDKVDPTNPPVSPATAFESLNLSSYDNISIERHQFATRNNDMQSFFNDDCSNDKRTILDDSGETLIPEADVAIRFAEQADHGSKLEQQAHNNIAEKDNNLNNKRERRQRQRSNSLSDCSDQIEDDDDAKNGRKSGKGPQCKNLVAERRRRKKLNERLYTLRSLVPKISKLDRASILGDAIEYVKDLKRQEKELQDELEEHNSDNDATNGKRNNPPSEISKFGPKSESPNNFSFETSGNYNNNNGIISKQNHDSDTIANDKAPQMEPQVEVAQIDGNEFFVKVFCEHKPGRFVRLIEALNSLALEVTNANVTTFRNLVSNVLKVEKKDSKMVVQADHLRDFLLELTRNPSRGLCEMSKALENGNNNIIDYQHHHHHVSDQFFK